MSRPLDPLLPEALLARLLPPGAADHADRVVVLATVDPFGWPHPALLTYGELLVLDAGRLRLAAGAGSRSARHLRETGRATLVFADGDLCLYVKAEALALPPAPPAPGLARFELAVREVLEDRAAGEEAGAGLAGALRARWPDAGAAAARRARLAALLGA
jgi:hypothetical protein